MKRGGSCRRRGAQALLALGLALGGGAALAQNPEPEGSGSGRYDRRLELPSAPAYLDDASRLPPMIPIIVQHQPSSRGRSPAVWLGGLLVLVAVFLWNRNRRAELERMEAAASQAPKDSPVDVSADAPADAPVDAKEEPRR